MSATDTDLLRDEYRALTESCGLVDRSDRGKLTLTGTGAVEFLNGQVTNELADLRPGEGRYAAFLTHKGKMLGDLRILAAGESPLASESPLVGNDLTAGEDPESQPSELLLDTERVALQSLFDMIRRFKVGYEVELHKRTLERGLLSLIGPESRKVAAEAAGIDLAAIPTAEHAHIPAEIAGHSVRLIATNASGVDVLYAAEHDAAVRGALERTGAHPVGEEAAEIVRVERGRPRYGVDMNDTTIPQEAGLNERAVSFTKGCYVGQETVARLYYRGKPNRHLRGLRLSAPATPGEELHLGERTVGHLSSIALSPALGPIALALVRREAEPGATVNVGEQNTNATVVDLPFA
ncbi:MAG TPA: glycine cleavage T C-terminal barrel domain-containing protein [Solirubrobacteraceae bacterium]|jgi:folate-binding protein YgfZ